jgi:hypothetical protein
MVLGVWHKVYVITFRVQGFKVYGFKIHGLGFNVWVLQYSISNVWFGVEGQIVNKISIY